MNADILRQAALDAINIPIFVLDRDLQIVFSNTALQDACRLYGIDPDVNGKSYDQAFPFLDEGTEDRYRRIFKTGQTEITIHTVELAKHEITMEIMRFPVVEDSRVTNVVVVGRNITATRQLEQSLRESEETTRALVNASTASMVLIDVEGRVITLNSIAAARLDRTVDQTIGMKAEDLLPPEVWRRRKEKIAEVIKSGLPVRFKDSRAGRTMDLSLLPIFDSAGQVYRLAVHGDDVTEREQATLALRDSDATARALMNSSSESMLLIDVSGRIVTLNETAAARMGKTVSELVGCRGQDIFAKEVWGPRSAGIQDIVRTRQPLRFIDHRMGRILDATICPVLDAQGEVFQVAVFARDITDQESTLAALRESEATARALLDASRESIILIDPDGTTVTLNEVAAERVHLTVADATGRNGRDLFPPEVWSSRQQRLQQVLQTGRLCRFTETQLDKTIDIAFCPILDTEGKVQKIAIYANDVTEYLKAMAALRTSEERSRRQFESIPAATFVWERVDRDFILRGYNRAADAMTNGNVSKLIGHSAREMYAQRPDIVRDMEACAETGTPIVREMMYRYQTTKIEKYVQAHFGFVPPNQVVVHAIDQTERRETEVALQVAQRTLEGEVERRTQELAQANEQLNVEREALRHKNIALQQVIEQASRSKDSLAEQIQANVERIILPVLDSLGTHLDPSGTKYLELARSSLLDIVSPYVRSLETKSRKLTSREIELCNLIRQGHSTKDIAGLRNTSVQTVLTQRKIIRRKLGILGKQVNLASFLMSMMSTQ